MHSLVIVESPAKAKTIEKYLGKDYEVKASMGHLRDLPKSKLGVDVDRDFEPVYEPIKGKEATINDLKKAVKKADAVYLATDPDREGEAISWHLKQLLDLPDGKTFRVTFNEITKRVVVESIQTPRDIDQDLVDAQQARRILDRLVGYKLSPLLWKKVRRGLSAGRVQSVATRMVDDREHEIEDFQPEEYWTLDAKLSGSAGNGNPFPVPGMVPGAASFAAVGVPGMADSVPGPAVGVPGMADSVPGMADSVPGPAVGVPGMADSVPSPAVGVPGMANGVPGAVPGMGNAPAPGLGFPAHFHGTDGKKRELHHKEEVDEIMGETKDAPFTVTKIKQAEKRRSPAPPFTTSTLQQEASRKLNMTPRRTMAIAQQLYEGVELSGEGSVGLITYMRTDSLRLSEEAIAAARNFISGRYGAAYCPEKPHRYKARGNAQDAHEAIRPSDVFRTPEQVKKDLTREQYNLYRLIWSRFVACQMSPAVFDAVSVEIQAGRHDFRASSSSLKFAGYTAVYEEGKDDEKEEKFSPLPFLREGQVLPLLGFDPQQHFTQPPARYTDATLIRAMEEQGIGRPSTYSPTVSTILDRQYVIKEGKYLRITNLGRAVTELMKERFSDIADLKFTARMENELDAVEEGKTPWKSVLREFYGNFDHSLEEAEKALEGVRIKVPDEVTEELCPVCGRNLVIKRGRFGPFLACPGYPDCTFTMPLVEVMPGQCPKCGGRLMKRTGVSQNTKKPYTYYCCENQVVNKARAATCDFRTWDVPVKDPCPVCGQTQFKRQGRGARKPFCINPACPNFLPEDKRGYPKRKTEENPEAVPENAMDAAAMDAGTAAAMDAGTVTEAAELTKKTAKRSTAKKAAATTKKAASATKKTAAAAKKAGSTTKKTAAKTTEKKTAGRTTARKTAEKTTAKKTAEKAVAAKKPATRKKKAEE